MGPVIHVGLSVVLGLLWLAILSVLGLTVLFKRLSVLNVLWERDDVICSPVRSRARRHWHVVDIVLESLTNFVLIICLVVSLLQVLVHVLREVGTGCQSLAVLVLVALDPFAQLLFVVT